MPVLTTERAIQIFDERIATQKSLGVPHVEDDSFHPPILNDGEGIEGLIRVKGRRVIGTVQRDRQTLEVIRQKETVLAFDSTTGQPLIIPARDKRLTSQLDSLPVIGIDALRRISHPLVDEIVKINTAPGPIRRITGTINRR